MSRSTKVSSFTRFLQTQAKHEVPMPRLSPHFNLPKALVKAIIELKLYDFDEDIYVLYDVNYAATGHVIANEYCGFTKEEYSKYLIKENGGQYVVRLQGRTKKLFLNTFGR